MDHFARTDDIGEAKIPHRGSVRILVVPVDFALPGLTPQNFSHLERFFGPARDDAPTLAGFFRDNSRGVFEVEPEIIDPKTFFSCPFAGLAPSDCRLAGASDVALLAWIPLVEKTLDDLEARGLDFSRFDVNGPAGGPDGWIDGVVISHNGISGDVTLPLSLFTADPVYGGIGIGGVAVVNNARPADGDYTGNDAAFLREFGHLLGFADLSDRDLSSYGLVCSIMGSSCDGEGNCDLPLLDAASRVLIGWAEEIEVRGRQEVLIAPAEEGGEVYRLGAGSRYFLVENRGRHPLWDGRIESRGLAVYRVNREKAPGSGPYDFLSAWHTGGPNAEEGDPFIMNIPADGDYELQSREGWMDPDDLFREGDVLGADQLSPFPDQLDADGVPLISLEVVDAAGFAPSIRARLAAPEVGSGPDNSLPEECGHLSPGNFPFGPVLLIPLYLWWKISRGRKSRW